MHTAEFVVTIGRESRYNQVPFVREKKRDVTIGRQLDAGAEFRGRHVRRAPELLASVRLQADELAAGFRRVHIVALQKGT